MESFPKKTKELAQLDRIAKMLVRRDFDLMQLQEKRNKQLQEMDRIAKMLIQRDLALSETRGKREKELEDSRRKTAELENSRRALMNILEDVEEARLEAETERDKTTAVIHDFPEGLLFFDASERVDLANPRVGEIFEMGPQELRGKTVEDLNRFSSLKPLAEILGSPIKQLARKELALGEDVVLEISTIRVRREQRIIGTLMILRDITREKTVERLKTEFVSLAAHQLRTPLSAIKWTLRMLLDEDLGEVKKEQREFLEKTYQSNERMIKLINDLLNVTRIEEGRFLYNVQSQDLKEIISQCLKASKQAAERKGLELKASLPRDRLPETALDEEKIVLALQNLIDNAIAYTKEGGVEVSLQYNKEKKEFLVAVKDTGIGIPKQYYRRLFTKFFRGADAQRTETEGTGLGLFIAKNIIEAHKGKIWFESEAGKGTTFYFSLPLRSEHGFE